MNETFAQFKFWSAIDIAIISFIVYHMIILLKGTRAAQMLAGILVVLAAFILSSIVPLTTVNWVMNKFYSSFLLFIIVLFQDEIRSALSKIGKNPLVGAEEGGSAPFRVIDQLSRAAGALSQNKTGALIVIEREIILSRYVDIGIKIDGQVTSELLQSIFQIASPVHDGAVIIQKGKIAAAGCFLPLTKSDSLSLDMGTRHRAGIGISEETDAVVILVSEERGTISIVHEGKISAIQNIEQLKRRLKKHFALEIQSEKSKATKQKASRSKTISLGLKRWIPIGPSKHGGAKLTKREKADDA